MNAAIILLAFLAIVAVGATLAGAYDAIARRYPTGDETTP